MTSEEEASERDMLKGAVTWMTPFSAFYLLGGLTEVGRDTGVWAPIGVLLALFACAFVLLYWSNWRGREWTPPLAAAVFGPGLVLQGFIYCWYLRSEFAEPASGVMFWLRAIKPFGYAFGLGICFLLPFIAAVQAWRKR